MSDIEARFKKIVAEQLGLNQEEVVNTASFAEDFDINSLDIVELLSALEDEFDTKIPEENLENISTVQEAIDYMKSHKDSKRATDPQ